MRRWDPERRRHWCRDPGQGDQGLRARPRRRGVLRHRFDVTMRGGGGFVTQFIGVDFRPSRRRPRGERASARSPRPRGQPRQSGRYTRLRPRRGSGQAFQQVLSESRKNTKAARRPRHAGRGAPRPRDDLGRPLAAASSFDAVPSTFGAMSSPHQPRVRRKPLGPKDLPHRLQQQLGQDAEAQACASAPRACGSRGPTGRCSPPARPAPPASRPASRSRGPRRACWRRWRAATRRRPGPGSSCRR